MARSLAADVGAARQGQADNPAVAGYGPILLPQHAALLGASAISTAVAEARGYRTVTKKTDALGLGFSRNQARMPALVIPIWGVIGEIVTYQLRPDEPRIDGRGQPSSTKPRAARGWCSMRR